MFSIVNWNFNDAIPVDSINDDNFISFSPSLRPRDLDYNIFNLSAPFYASPLVHFYASLPTSAISVSF